MVSQVVQFRFTLIFTWSRKYEFELLDELFGSRNSKHLSVNASISRDIRTRGMLEDVVATQRTIGRTCPLGVCSYVLEMLDMVNLARN